MQFSKMQSLSNDFIVIDAITQKISLSSEKIKFLSNRRLGIGCDQILIIESSNKKNIDFYYRIFNSDGNEVFQCGNGARCVAKFLKIKKLTKKNKIIINTKTSYMILSFISKNNFIKVNMGCPKFAPQDIPYLSNKIHDNYKINFNNKTIKFHIVSIGNPHCIIETENVYSENINEIAFFLLKHKNFPHGVNVSFMERMDSKNIRLRVYERGVGETPSCGSAACAAVSIGIKKNILEKEVLTHFSGGTLKVLWKKINSSIFIIGSATHVYDGYIDL